MTYPCMNVFTAIVAVAALQTGSTVFADHHEKGEGWVDLFDGKTLEGWQQKNGTATYRVEEGTVVGRTNEGSPNSFLCKEKL